MIRFDHNNRTAFYGLSIVAGLLILAILILSWVPPVSRDALTHHLAVPKIYLEHGGIVEIPEIPFSYYPMNLDILYILPLYFGNDIIPKLIHFTFALMTAALIYFYLKSRLNPVTALFGSVFYLSIPVILKLSITVYVDLGLAFFFTAALICLFRWFEPGGRLKYFIFSAVFCGLALGTKYNGLVGLFILTLCAAYLYLRQCGTGAVDQLKSIGYASAYLLIALIVFSPWLIRNYTWTGNPIYPLYNKVFKAASVVPEEDLPMAVKSEKKSTGGWNNLTIRRIIFNESWIQIILIPLRVFFEGRDDDPRYFDGQLNPFLLFLLIPAFLKSDKAPVEVVIEKRVMLAFAVLFMLIAFLRTQIRIRYIVPILPPLVILSMYGLDNLADYLRNSRYKRLCAVIVGLIAFSMMSINAAYVFKQFRIVDPLSFISGKIDRETYITRYRPEHPVALYVNRQTAADAKILGLFLGNRRYYFDRQLITGRRGSSLFGSTLREAASAEQMKVRLQNRGFTHLIVRYDVLKQWAGAYDAEKAKMIEAFFNQGLQFVFAQGGYGLYRL